MSDRQAESALFVKMYDLLVWLAHCVAGFPRAQRFLLASSLMHTAYACHADLIRSRKVTAEARAQALLDADVELETLRMQWRVAHDLHCISTSQYEHGARLMDEVGRLLGARRK
jgi:hypothetical protein